MLKGKFAFDADFFGSLLKPKSPPLIGVDISSSSVKMVELTGSGRGRYRLERYTIEPLPKDAVVDGNIMNLEEVGDALRRGWKRMGTRAKNLAMALPSEKKSWCRPDRPMSNLKPKSRLKPTNTFPLHLKRSISIFRRLGLHPTARKMWKY